MSFRNGIVVAGGQGVRMGRPKRDIQLAGVTLVERARAILQSVGCDPIVVADDGDDGPLAALVEPLNALDGFEVFVLACDLPLAKPAVDLLAALPAGAVIAADDTGREQPLCARWPRAVAADTARDLVEAGERRMMALVDVIDPELVIAPDDALLNVNTPADLERAALLLRN